MLKRVKSGEHLRTQPINALVDLGNKILRLPGGMFSAGGPAGVPAFGINTSDVDIPVGGCVSFKEDEANPYPDSPRRQLQETVLQLGVPAAAADDWCIAAQRIPAGLGGWVFISGLLLARVRDETSSDMTVDIDPSTDWWHLKQGASGAGKVIWLDTVSQAADDADPTPYRWALIRFPFGGGGGGTAELDVVQAVADGSAGSVSVKSITLKAADASPNFTLAASAQTVKYFHL